MSSMYCYSAGDCILVNTELDGAALEDCVMVSDEFTHYYSYPYLILRKCFFHKGPFCIMHLFSKSFLQFPSLSPLGRNVVSFNYYFYYYYYLIITL